MIKLTNSAVKKTQKLLENEDSAMHLRVFVVGGGCSGFEYGFTFDDILDDEDTLVDNNSVKVVIDAMSFQYLTGSEIDYVEDLTGSKFIVNNPNALITCGCGNSFTV